MNIPSFAAVNGALLGLFLAVALLMSRGHGAYANRLLAASIMLSTAYLLALIPIHSPGLASLDFLRIGGLSIFLFGPALFFYVRTTTASEFRLRYAHLVHTIPFLLILADQQHLFAAFAENDKTLLLANPRPLSVFYYLQIIAYLLASIRLLYGFHHRIAENYSSLEGITLRWLSALVSLALLLSALGLAFSLGRWLFDAISWPQRIWSIGMMITINYLIAFFAITQPALFSSPAVERTSSRETSARYETSSLTPAQADEIWNLLEQWMTQEQPYLKNQLKIRDLAAEMDLPANHLSQTINQVGKCSFFAYINRHRVNAACELLQETGPGDRTILDIALASGFNSESAFYKQFRNQIGITPRQFQLEN